MSQRGNDHSLLNETNEFTFFSFVIVFDANLLLHIQRGKKSKCGSPYQPYKREKATFYYLSNIFTRGCFTWADRFETGLVC